MPHALFNVFSRCVLSWREIYQLKTEGDLPTRLSRVWCVHCAHRVILADIPANAGRPPGVVSMLVQRAQHWNSTGWASGRAGVPYGARNSHRGRDDAALLAQKNPASVHRVGPHHARYVCFTRRAGQRLLLFDLSPPLPHPPLIRTPQDYPVLPSRVWPLSTYTRDVWIRTRYLPTRIQVRGNPNV